MEYDNTNSGVLFRNDKATSASAPEYTGTINIDGVEKRLAAWVKESKKTGKKFFSLKVSDPIVAGEDTSGSKPMDQEIPF